MRHCFQSFSKTVRFDDLVTSVRHCNLCTRLCERTKVLSYANGDLEAKVLFVAEAPGRLGADKTGVPLHGDKTGDNFENLLGNVGWQRTQVFITNAVLCNPRQKNGNNGTPTVEEIANCSSYLEMVISLVHPAVIVSLGITALKALDLISPHGIDLRDGVAKMVTWSGIKLFPLYHPGPRALVHRSLAKQRSDFMSLAKVVHPERGLKETRKKTCRIKPSDSIVSAPLHQVARAFLELAGRMTYFKLMKLLYLFDLCAVRTIGRTYASDIYIRQVDGPWAPKLDEALSSMDGFEVIRYHVRRIPMVRVGPSQRCEILLQDEILEMVVDTYEKYGGLTNSRIKTVAYLTDPMRFILKEEEAGKDMRNKAVLYKDKTSRDLAGG
ncbi:MAG: uracil-DNA glycosylase family protein [Desulfomonilaceae bacterium]